MRWLIGVAIVVVLSAGPAWAAPSQTELLCKTFQARWEKVGAGEDVAAMDRAIAWIPPSCAALRAQAKARRRAVAQVQAELARRERDARAAAAHASAPAGAGAPPPSPPASPVAAASLPAQTRTAAVTAANRNGYAARFRGNFVEAMAWWRIAADQGDPEAETLIGSLFYQGEGVAQSSSQAIVW
jgi:hypothetical protein